MLSWRTVHILESDQSPEQVVAGVVNAESGGVLLCIAQGLPVDAALGDCPVDTSRHVNIHPADWATLVSLVDRVAGEWQVLSSEGST